jgi:putative transcriptional regulator
MAKTNHQPIFQVKGDLTKFQILLEIMRNQPHVKQKDISEKLGITIPAVSKYFKKLTDECLLEAGSERADYHLTPKGVTKLQDDMRNMEDYVNGIKMDLKIERAWPAIATQPVKVGQEVGLIMKEGIIYTVPTDSPLAKAKGTALADANIGDDLGLKDLHGKINVKPGKIMIVKLPSIRKGGSRVTDMAKVKAFYNEFKPDRIGVMGTVGRAVLNKIGEETDLEFGISRSAAIAASRGLNVFILAVDRMVNRIIQEIDLTNMKSGSSISYEVKDAHKKIEFASKVGIGK